MNKDGTAEADGVKMVSYPIRFIFGAIDANYKMSLLVVYECENGRAAYLKVLSDYTTGPYIKNIKFIDEKEGESRIVWRVKIIKPEQRLFPFLGIKEEWAVDHILIRRDAHIIPDGSKLSEMMAWQR